MIVSVLVLTFFSHADSTPNEVFEVESAVIRCQNPESVQDDDFQVVNWKPIPLTSFNEPIYPGPHEPDSALDTEMENDVDLNITRATKCRHQALITVKVSHDGTVRLDFAKKLIYYNSL